MADEFGAPTSMDVPPDMPPPEMEQAATIQLSEAEIPDLAGMKKGDMITLIVETMADDGTYTLSVKK